MIDLQFHEGCPYRRERGSMGPKEDDMTGRGCGREPFYLVTSFIGRLKGLLFMRPPARPILLVRCRSIHTFGMRHDADIAFLDREGRVLASYRRVRPLRCISQRHAAAVLERFSEDGGPWPQEGERLFFVTGSSQGYEGPHNSDDRLSFVAGGNQEGTDAAKAAHP